MSKKIGNPEESVGDKVLDGTLSIVEELPGGRVGTKIFNILIGTPYAARLNEWRIDVTDKLNSIGVSPEILESNEAFLDAVMQGSQAALKTHEKEKLTALRNAVVNTTLPNPPDESLQQIFIQFVDEFTVWHLRLLNLLSDPEKWFVENDKTAQKFGNRRELVEFVYPELLADKYLLDLIIRDLNTKNLIGIESLSGMMTAVGVMQKATTENGDRFLGFISDSDSLDGQDAEPRSAV